MTDTKLVLEAKRNIGAFILRRTTEQQYARWIELYDAGILQVSDFTTYFIGAAIMNQRAATK